jgi:transcription antitermination factor NusG
MWKKPYPSKDGEALRKVARREARVLSNLTADCAREVPPQAKWFALYTTSRHEKRIAQHLTQRGIEFYLPLYCSSRKWRDGSKVTLNLPLFPGYVFVHIQRSERTRVLEIPGALSIVGGTGKEPASVPEATIAALRAGLELRAAQPHPLMTAGQRVRIRSGAMAGFEGVVVRSKNSFRVVLTLEQIMQSYAVEVGRDDLELLQFPDPSECCIPAMSPAGE